MSITNLAADCLVIIMICLKPRDIFSLASTCKYLWEFVDKPHALWHDAAQSLGSPHTNRELFPELGGREPVDSFWGYIFYCKDAMMACSHKILYANFAYIHQRSIEIVVTSYLQIRIQGISDRITLKASLFDPNAKPTEIRGPPMDELCTWLEQHWNDESVWPKDLQAAVGYVKTQDHKRPILTEKPPCPEYPKRKRKMYRRRHH